MRGVDLRTAGCGCCRPVAATTPEPLDNRPALDAVAYRTGTWTSFRRSMLDLVPIVGEQLAAEHGLATRPLQRWTSRSSDDHGIALLELWATLADVLTFYQERYAQRAWLRTARERDAVRHLAGLLGYRLKPGVAAGTHLAVTVDDGVELTVPTGLRVQSVPAEGQRPQTFEVDAPVEAISALNAVPVLGEPRALAGGALADQRAGGTLAAASVVPRVGDAVVLCTDGLAGVEHRTVAAVETVDDRAVVRWSRPLEHGHAQAFQRGRTHRLFGHSAPETWTQQAATDPPSGFVIWTQWNTKYAIDPTTTLHLDGTVDGIEPGSYVLVIDHGGVAHVHAVEDVRPTTATVEPLADEATDITAFPGPATALTLDVDDDLSYSDLRDVVVHELGGELTFLDWELPDEPLPAGTTAVYVPYPEVATIPDGRLLVLADAAGDPMLIAADGDATPSGPGDVPEFLRVELATPTTRELDHRSAVLLGNVAPASHGASVDGEVLGDGAAAEALQTFAVAKAPVTHVTDPTAPGGAGTTLEVLVDGVHWEQRRTLLAAAPDERAYTTDIDDDATMTVRFGDGVNGARLPTGRGNVIAGYRVGLGVDGNLAAGQLTTALDRPTGLSAVHNPLPASGGVDPETTDAARTTAPTTVRTFDRAVALDDFAHLAGEYVGVAKAHATWVWDGQERVVHVTVGGEDGATLDATLPNLLAYLDARRDPNRTLRVSAYRPVPFVLRLQIDVDANRRTDDVAAAVADAIAAYFAYDSRAFGQAVHLSDVYHVVQGVDGVMSALVTALDYRETADRADHPAPIAPAGFGDVSTRGDVLTRGDARGTPLRAGLPRFPGGGFPTGTILRVLLHAPIASARPDRATGDVLPAELATLDAADLLVTTTGGIAS